MDDFVPTTDAMPEEFVDPEGDAELYDPKFSMEATTSDLRKMWGDWLCHEGSGKYADQHFFGKTIGGVPAAALDAFRALEQALKATGYKPSSSWAYNCRNIAGTKSYSLHSYGIAIDIDPKANPFSKGDPYSGKVKEQHVDAVLKIKNKRGHSVWSWGGKWKRRDRMHFQLDQDPSNVDVDWSTVPEGDGMTATVMEKPAVSQEKEPVTRNTGKANSELIDAAFAASWTQGDKNYWHQLSADSAEWSDFWNACYAAAEKVTRNGKPANAWIDAAFAAGWAQGDKNYWHRMSANNAEWSDFWKAFTAAVG